MSAWIVRRSIDWFHGFADFIRGFTDEDVRMLQYRLRLLATQPAGQMIWLTPQQTRALQQGHVIGVWSISVTAVIRGQARISIRQPAPITLT
jgi:hypothetical protein